jgi:hypothetical protein
VEDLSHLAANSLAPTSQHAGNQVWANNAMTAPGGDSGDLGDDVGAKVVTPAPTIDMIDVGKPSTDGKPQPRGDQGPDNRPAWRATTTPNVVRVN